MEHGPDKSGRDMEIARALDGKILYGNDFSQAEIEEWFRTEQEGYFNLYYAPQGVNGKAVEIADQEEYWFSGIVEWHLMR